MPYSGMFRRVVLVRTDVSEELNSSIIRVNLPSVLRLLVAANVLPSSSILVSLIMEVILHSHRRENLKS
jgi:hypothetical protein